MSTPADRIAIIHASYSDAYARRAEDLKAASTEDDAQAVLDNIDSLEGSYLTAAKQSLDATGPAIESAYDEAAAARDEVETAYEQARSLADKIRAVAHSASSIASLVRKAAGV